MHPFVVHPGEWWKGWWGRSPFGLLGFLLDLFHIVVSGITGRISGRGTAAVRLDALVMQFIMSNLELIFFMLHPQRESMTSKNGFNFIYIALLNALKL